jgi:hypothetical protein
MALCAGIKRDGGRCTAVVPPSKEYCYQHDPERKGERKRNASRAGKSRGNGEIAGLKEQLRKLAGDVLEGNVDRSAAAVVNQIINTRARLLEVERRIKETEELEERLEALEGVLKGRRTG